MSNDVHFGTEVSSIFIISSNELKRVVFDPLSIIVFVFLVLLVFLEGEGLRYTGFSSGASGLIASLNYGLYPMGQYFAAVAVFLGAMSLSEERSHHSLSILLTKPLYRRDILLGKFLGLSIFLLSFIFAVYFAYSLVLFILVGTPISLTDFTLRCVTLALVMFLESSLAMSMAILAGVVFKKGLQAAVVGVTFFFMVWYSSLLTNLGSLNSLSPFMLLFQIIMGNGDSYQLLDSATSYSIWFNAAFPFLVFIVLEIFVMLAVDCLVFVRREEV